jgi:CRP-like cAMP-binding protein
MFFVVESGEASVEIHGEEIATLGPGATFGEIALIDRRPRTATVTALSDLRTYGLPVFVFRPFVEARPDVAWKMLESMADRLAAERGEALGNSLGGPRQREPSTEIDEIGFCLRPLSRELMVSGLRPPRHAHRRRRSTPPPSTPSDSQAPCLRCCASICPLP